MLERRYVGRCCCVSRLPYALSISQHWRRVSALLSSLRSLQMRQRVQDSDTLLHIDDCFSDACPSGFSRAFVSACALDDKIYAIGGHDGRKVLKTCERYDPATNTWTPIADLTFPRTDCQTLVFGDRVLAIGGDADTLVHADDTIECYDSKADKWVMLPTKMPAREMFAACVMGDYIYVGGGLPRWNRDFATRAFDRLNFSSLEWEPLCTLPSPRCVHKFVAVDGKIYAVGGHDGDKATSSVDVYDADTNAWTQAGSGPRSCTIQSRAMCMAVPFGGTKLLVAGGVDQRSGKRYSTEVFDREHLKWELGPAMISRRASGGMVMLSLNLDQCRLPTANPAHLKIASTTVESAEQSHEAALRAAGCHAAEVKILSEEQGQCNRDPRCPKPNKHTGRCKVNIKGQTQAESFVSPSPPASIVPTSTALASGKIPTGTPQTA